MWGHVQGKEDVVLWWGHVQGSVDDEVESHDEPNKKHNLNDSEWFKGT